MFLDTQVRQKLDESGFTPVFLYADAEVIKQHLQEGDNWRKRSNYRNSGAQSWMHLVDQHCEERTPDMQKFTSVAIDVSELNPREVAREVVYRLHEYRVLKPKQIASYGCAAK